MRCPKCDNILLKEHTHMNGEKITIISCECGFMKIESGWL